MPRRTTVVRFWIPALLVGVLALIALWRVGLPADQAPGTTASGEGRPSAESPITIVAELLTQNAVGRRASVTNVEVRRVVTTRAFWIGAGNDKPAFVVLDPDVKRFDSVRITPGARLDLVGLVRPAPDANRAMQQWGLDDTAAREAAGAGTYLHVTEIAAGKH
jgi:hypothetical protein